MKKYIVMLLATALTVGCESLEDTYKDLAGDGPIRYVGKCYDVNITPGWKRLELTWKSNCDPTIEHIKVSWKSENVKRDSLLPADATLCNIKNLTDGSYEVSVCAVDLHGNTSLSEIVFSRPYTMQHDFIRSFPRVVVKNFFVRNTLILFFDPYNESITKAEIEYTKADGTTVKSELTRDIIDGKFYQIPDQVDLTKPVKVLREGHIEGSSDVILLDPIVLGHEIMLSTDFKQLIRRSHGSVDITPELLERITELDVDYSLNSLEDILYFPNLKVLNLGKKRYLIPQDGRFPYAQDSKVNEASKSEFALKVVNQIGGLKVNRYNYHFRNLRGIESFTTQQTNLAPPDQTFLPHTDWKFSCTPVGSPDFDSGFTNLFDNDPTTQWRPETSSTFRTHEILIDMGEIKSLKGIQLAQVLAASSNDGKVKPQLVKIVVSTDQNSWSSPTHLEWEPLGSMFREVTEINFLSNTRGRYVKLFINDMMVGTNYYTLLAEIKLF